MCGLRTANAKRTKREWLSYVVPLVEVACDAGSDFGRFSEFDNSGCWADLQRSNSGGSSLADFHPGILDWNGRNARLDLPHRRRLLRLLLRERAPGKSLKFSHKKAQKAQNSFMCFLCLFVAKVFQVSSDAPPLEFHDRQPVLHHHPV